MEEWLTMFMEISNEETDSMFQNFPVVGRCNCYGFLFVLFWGGKGLANGRRDFDYPGVNLFLYFS